MENLLLLIIFFLLALSLFFFIGDGSNLILALSGNFRDDYVFDGFQQAVVKMEGCDPCDTTLALVTIADDTCNEDFETVTRIIFQKRNTVPADQFKFTSAAQITTQSEWTTLLSATDATKVVITPRNKITKFKITPGEPERTSDTPTGNERIMGVIKKTKITGQFVNLTAQQYEQIYTAFCVDTVVFFVTAQNRIIAKRMTDTNIQGLPVMTGTKFLSSVETQDTPISQQTFNFEFLLEDLHWFPSSKKYKTDFANLL